MPRKLSHIAPDWWDYTTLDSSLINDAAKLTEQTAPDLYRQGILRARLRASASVSPFSHSRADT